MYLILFLISQQLYADVNLLLSAVLFLTCTETSEIRIKPTDLIQHIEIQLYFRK